MPGGSLGVHFLAGFGTPIGGARFDGAEVPDSPASPKALWDGPSFVVPEQECELEESIRGEKRPTPLAIRFRSQRRQERIAATPEQLPVEVEAFVSRRVPCAKRMHVVSTPKRKTKPNTPRQVKAE